MLEHDNSSLVKINKTYLETIKNNNVLNFFGDWVNNIEKLKHEFLNAEPFENIVIDNFLNNEYAEIIHDLFPTNYDNWHKYENPIEVKYTYDDISKLPTELTNIFYYLSTDVIIRKFCELTDMHDLEYDEYLHGAGLHCHPNYGRLNIHLDYEKHPITYKERRLNVILFLSKEWDPEWNGANELWDKNVTKCVKKTNVKYNRAVIFKTNDISWHGVPDKIKCPEHIFRKSLAYYYVSPLNSLKSEEMFRKKANYIKKPDDPYDPNIEELYKIRKNRRITNEDLNKYFPNWSKMF